MYNRFRSDVVSYFDLMTGSFLTESRFSFFSNTQLSIIRFSWKKSKTRIRGRFFPNTENGEQIDDQLPNVCMYNIFNLFLSLNRVSGGYAGKRD